MDRLAELLSLIVTFGLAFWLGKLWDAHRVEAAENKAEDILAERNYWKDIAQKEVAENIKLAREITVLVKPAATIVERAVRDHQAEDEEGEPMSVREADRLEMQRRREAENPRRKPKPEDDEGDREPVHIDDRRASPPPRTTDLIRDE